MSLILFLSCRSSPTKPEQDKANTNTYNDQILAQYRGNMSSADYDSIVNQLTLYKNETFSLNQLDRIAEHRLHERTHEGVYGYLKDSAQLGLFSGDGTLMIRLLITDQGLIPMTVNGDGIPDRRNLWKSQPQ